MAKRLTRNRGQTDTRPIDEWEEPTATPVVEKKYKPRRKEVRLDQVNVPPEIANLRTALDQDHVDQMVLVVRDLKPIPVAMDSQGGYSALGGLHRMAAHRQAGEEWIDADIYDDLPHTKWLAFAVEDNRENALPLSKEERKAAAHKLIKTTDNDSEIARLCGFDRKTIGEWRGSVMVGDSPTMTEGQKGRRLRKGPGTNVRAYEEANPDASISQVSNETGASRATVSRGRRLARRGPPGPQPTDPTAGASTPQTQPSNEEILAIARGENLAPSQPQPTGKSRPEAEMADLVRALGVLMSGRKQRFTGVSTVNMPTPVANGAFDHYGELGQLLGLIVPVGEAVGWTGPNLPRPTSRNGS
jgi:hypothetical protein